MSTALAVIGDDPCLRLTVTTRILSRLTLNEGGCWEYGKTCSEQGYGEIRIGSQKTRIPVHRWMATIAHGQIPEDLIVLHSCDNPPCCNPSHLSIGTHADNHRDRQAKGRTRGLIPGGDRHNAKKTHCPAGHPYEGDNLYVTKQGYRGCRECKRQQDRAAWIRRIERRAQRDLLPASSEPTRTVRAA